MRRVIVALVLAAICSPVRAEQLENLDSVDIVINGTIAQQCALGTVGNIDFGNLERPGLSISRSVAFQCNMPFTMAIEGRRGALTHSRMPNGQGDFSGTVPYAIAIDVPLRHPSLELARHRFDSRDLAGGRSFTSNGGIASDNMTLSVELGSAPGSAGLLGGDYSETITITVSPS